MVVWLGINILRSQNHSKLLIVDAVGPTGVRDRSDGGNDAEKVGQFSYSVGHQAAIGDVMEKSNSSRDRKAEINRIGRSSSISNKTSKNRKLEVAAATATVVLGVGNRVLYKLALVPLKHYSFLAQLATFGSVEIKV